MDARPCKRRYGTYQLKEDDGIKRDYVDGPESQEVAGRDIQVRGGRSLFPLRGDWDVSEACEQNGIGFEWVGRALEIQEGRRYFSCLCTPDGENIPLGAAICVWAPRGQPAFLAQVVAMWENESDGSKLYRCRWFFRPSQAFKASALQVAQRLHHPREVFISDEFDVNSVNTIQARTIVVHRDCLPGDFSLDSLRIGDHFFYRSKYERKTHHFSDVDRPASGLLGSNPSLRKPAARGSGKPEKEDVSTAPVVLEEDVFELMRAAERHQKTISQETAVALGEE